MVVIEASGLSDVGMKREGNEDSLYLNDNQSLYVVADGMGGHLAGEVASALVVETIETYMTRFADDDHAEELADEDETISKEANRLLAGIRLANQAVHDISKRKKEYRGMGSTVAAALFTDDRLIVANVGDSPVFLIHNGEIEQLSITHNVITEQMAIDPEAAKTIGLQFRHMLTRGMGIEATVRPDICEVQYFRNDCVVISSDGLTDKVAPEEILEIVLREKPEKACRILVNMANERGGDDNITVITAKVRDIHGGKGGFWKRIAKFFSRLNSYSN